MSKINLNLTRPSTAMSTIVDPVAASVTASVPPSRAHTSHSLSRAAHRATGHTSGYGRLLSAPMPSRPVCRLEPLEMVHLQLRHSLSRASLLSSGTSRLSLTHVPSAAWDRSPANASSRVALAFAPAALVDIARWATTAVGPSQLLEVLAHRPFA